MSFVEISRIDICMKLAYNIITIIKGEIQMNSDFKAESGVYCIENKKNHKKYVGSSKNIHSRINTHKYDLKYKKHHSAFLQSDYNKNPKDLEFSVVKYCDYSEALKLEQELLETGEYAYNTKNTKGNFIENLRKKEDMVIARTLKFIKSYFKDEDTAYIVPLSAYLDYMDWSILDFVKYYCEKSDKSLINIKWKVIGKFVFGFIFYDDTECVIFSLGKKAQPDNFEYIPVESE